eukprot:scaffold617_cov94-Skeletonema_marinoi.AAC.5
MGHHHEDMERLGDVFPDASRADLWNYLPPGGNINTAVVAMIEDGFVFGPRGTNEGYNRDAKRVRPGSAPRESENTPPTPDEERKLSARAAASTPVGDTNSGGDLLSLSPLMESATLSDSIAPAAFASAAVLEPAPAAAAKAAVIEPAPAAAAKAAVIEPLPDYVLGEITDPHDSDEQWHEGGGSRSHSADYVFYQGLVSSKKSKFDDAVHLDHQKGSVSKHWLVNEEKFTEFLAKHHKREPGYEIAKEALAQHQGRFYIVRNGKRYEVSKTHPQVLHKAYKTLCAIKMSHALPDYVLGEITDPQDSDEQWHEEGGGSRSQGAGYVYYHGLVSSKKSEFDDAVHLDHQKRTVEKHWLVNEEKFTEFLAKHHKREPGYEIAKEALAQHQGRFYI